MNKKTIVRILAFTTALILSLSVVITAFAAYETIPFGEQSDRVRKMQKALRSKGYYKGSVDGKFGADTRKAVYRFQNSLGIKADGKPGNSTLTALYEGSSALNKTSNTERKELTKPSNPRTLYYGCTGSRVKQLQKALKAAGVYGGALDGVYGDLTYQAVRKYQSQRGLHVDGMAGTKTLASLTRNTNVQIGTTFVLAKGSKGAEVKKLTRYLRDEGYLLGASDVYTADVANAVQLWQEDNGRSKTGTVSESAYNAYIVK